MFNLENFKTTNRIRFLNTFIQIVLTASLILGLNFLSSKHYLRFELSPHRHSSLSPETIAYLKKINQPVDIFIIIPHWDYSNNNKPNPIAEDILELISNFKEAAIYPENLSIRTELINPYIETQRLKEIASKYTIHKENAIIFASGNKSQQISANDLYIHTQDGQIEFKGEQVFISSLLYLTQPKRQKIYFIQGHGEMQTTDVSPSRGLSEFAHFLESLNFDIAPLHLTQTISVPDDAHLVILSSPQTPLMPIEVAQLRSYLSTHKGQLLAFIDPHFEHGLDRLFSDWGLLSENLPIIDPATSTHTPTGNLILRNYAHHPITDFLLDQELPLLAGLSRPVRPNPQASIDEKLSTTALISSSPSSWAERHFIQSSPSEFNTASDLQGPLPIATIAERTINSELGINVPGGRLIVFGNSDLLSNSHFNALGNKILFQNVINYTLDRFDLLHITPKKIQKYQLSFSKKTILHIVLALSSFPLVVACAAIFVYLIRRK